MICGCGFLWWEMEWVILYFEFCIIGLGEVEIVIFCWLYVCFLSLLDIYYEMNEDKIKIYVEGYFLVDFFCVEEGI